jgi:hypothetical protein
MLFHDIGDKLIAEVEVFEQSVVGARHVDNLAQAAIQTDDALDMFDEVGAQISSVGIDGIIA